MTDVVQKINSEVEEAKPVKKKKVYDPELAEIEDQLIPQDAKRDYYKGVFSNIRRHGKGGFNSNGFWWSFGWLIYRKCGSVGWMLMLVSIAAFGFGLLIGCLVSLVIGLYVGSEGNQDYHNSIRAKALTAKAMAAEDRETYINMRKGTESGGAALAIILYLMLSPVVFMLGKLIKL